MKCLDCYGSDLILDIENLKILIIYNYIDLFKKIIGKNYFPHELILLPYCDELGKIEIIQYYFKNYTPDLTLIQSIFDDNLKSSCNLLEFLLEKGAVFNCDNCKFVFQSKTSKDSRSFFKKYITENYENHDINIMFRIACNYNDKQMMDFLIEFI